MPPAPNTGAVRMLTTAGDPVAGVTFTVDGPGSPRTAVTNAEDVAWVDGLALGDFVVTETVPAGYVAAGENPQA